MAKGWIGVDLDGVLAYYENFEGPTIIGEPIVPMLNRVKMWLRQGKEVKIFTARAGYGEEAKKAITSWLVRNGLPPLSITNVKDKDCIAIYDDKAYRVLTNTGRILGVY